MGVNALQRVKVFLLDVDGVVIIGRTPIPGAAEGLRILKKCGTQVRLLTNNSTRSKEALAQALKEVGIEVGTDDLITSSYGAAKYLVSNHLKSAYVVGEKGLIEELKEAGITIVGPDAKHCDAVVVGLDRGLTYEKLATAFRLIRGGAKFVATNADATLPTEEGEIPGAASAVFALQASLKRRPLILGKPNAYLAKLALRETGVRVEACAVVGDRWETDIAMARKSGCLGIIVLTGVASSTRVEDYPDRFRPDMIYPSLLDLARAYERVRE